MIALFQFLQLALYILSLIIIAQAVMSWLIAFNVINAYNETTRSIYRTLTLRIMPDLGSVDLSPLVVLLIIQLLANRVLPAIMLP